MPIMNIEKMESIAEQLKQQDETLQKLISTPYNPEDQEQKKILNKYMDDFELNSNKMYLYQGAGASGKYWLGTWIFCKFLPIPDFINYSLVTFMYLGAAGYLLERYSAHYFYKKLSDMKIIYNWCLKNNQEQVPSDLNNDEKLCSPDIQRLIKLLAPLCKPDFLIAWPNKEESAGWTSSLTTGYGMLQTFLSAKPTVGKQELERLRDLKIKTEKGLFKLSIYDGFEQAIRYFINTIPDFKVLMNSQVKIVKPIASEYIKDVIHPKNL